MSQPPVTPIDLSSVSGVTPGGVVQDARTRAASLWSAEADGPILVLVRHGRTDWNATGRFVGRTDVPLDTIGHRQARLLAERLPGPFTAAYASPLRRARDTARPVHDPADVVEALAELDQGALEGLDGPTAIGRFPEFFHAFKADPGRARVPGGETLGELRDRAMDAVHRVAREHGPGERIALFTHQMVISSLTCAALGRPLTAWRDHRVGNAAFTALDLHRGRLRVLEADVRLVADVEQDGA